MSVTTGPTGAVAPNEAAHYLGLSVKTLANWRSLGNGPAYVRYGSSGRVAYRIKDLDAFMAKNRVATTN